MEDYDGGFIHSSPKRDTHPKRSTRHLTIPQLLSIDLTNPNFKLHDHDLSTIITIGWIDTIKRTSSGYAFTISDFSSTIDASFWPNSLFEENMTGNLLQNNIVKIVGVVRVFNQKPNISVNYILRVEDPNEIVYHGVAAIHETLFMQNRLKKKTVGKLNIQQDILDVYRKNQDENGLHVDIVVRMLANRYAEGEVRECVEVLVNDCHLYSVDGMEYHTTV